MNEETLRDLIAGLQTGRVSPDQAVAEIRRLPYVDLTFAKVDHHRQLRQGLPEAIYAPGKSASQCADIVTELLVNGDGPVILSRANPAQTEAALSANPGGRATDTTVVWRPAETRNERICIVTAGTADLPVAEEAGATLAALGFDAELLVDCGVAGIHRLMDQIPTLQQAEVVIAVAGMEGALASVIGGLTAAPVIAVPTSVGYGSSLEGVTALLAMMSSCASGVTVVGIDNGFGAACATARLLNKNATTV